MEQTQLNEETPDYNHLIFGKRKPGIKQFIRYVNNPENNVEDCYEFYYKKALSEWPQQCLHMQAFLESIIIYNRQRFLNYLIKKTIMGKLRSPVNHPVATAIVMIMHEKLSVKAPFTRRGFAFSYCLGFCPNDNEERRLKCRLNSIGYVKNLFKYDYSSHLSLGDLRDFLNDLEKKSQESEDVK